MTVVVALVALVLVIFIVGRAAGRQEEPQTTAPPRKSSRIMQTPYPAARILELPGLRLIDLRALPAEDLAAVRLGVAQAQLRLERPATVQIWVVDVATARGWTKLSPVALVIAASRLADPRFPRGTNYLYTSGGKLDDTEQATLAAAGVQVVLEMTNLSNPPRTIEDLLPAPPLWAPSSDDRPVPEHDVIGFGLLGEELVHVISQMGYIDLRRAAPAGLETGAALEHVENAVAELRRIQPLSHVVWVLAPWVLERLGDAQVARIERLVDSLPASLAQRLAIVTAEGEPVGETPFMRRLAAKLRPMQGAFTWKTAVHGQFQVAMIDALHDAYFVHAWKQPRA